MLRTKLISFFRQMMLDLGHHRMTDDSLQAIAVFGGPRALGHRYVYPLFDVVHVSIRGVLRISLPSSYLCTSSSNLTATISANV